LLKRFYLLDRLADPVGNELDPRKLLGRQNNPTDTLRNTVIKSEILNLFEKVGDDISRDLFPELAQLLKFFDLCLSRLEVGSSRISSLANSEAHEHRYHLLMALKTRRAAG